MTINKMRISYRKKKNRKKSDYFSIYKNVKKYFFLSLIFSFTLLSPGFPRWLSGKDPPAYKGDAGDMGSIPRSGRFPWRRAWQPTPVFLLENLMDRGAWQATIHGVAESQT